jgi:hypothetical protein
MELVGVPHLLLIFPITRHFIAQYPLWEGLVNLNLENSYATFLRRNPTVFESLSSPYFERMKRIICLFSSLR